MNSLLNITIFLASLFMGFALDGVAALFFMLMAGMAGANLIINTFDNKKK